LIQNQKGEVMAAVSAIRHEDEYRIDGCGGRKPDFIHEHERIGGELREEEANKTTKQYSLRKRNATGALRNKNVTGNRHREETRVNEKGLH
jgi:hypothetical protein